MRSAQVDGDLANGDQIWVEHKDGTTWVACAKSTVPSDTLATWVNSTGYYNPNIYMRACISFSVHGNRSTVCGTPVKDHPES